MHPVVHDTEVEGCRWIEMARHFDHRGFFEEIYQHSKLDFGVEWRQVNWSQSDKNVLRGLHVANYPKLVTCITGKIFDVVVDFRENSKTYLKWFGIELDEYKNSQIFVPAGCGHGFLALKDSNVIYLQGDVWRPDSEITLRYDDPKFNINWPIVDSDYILSDKDKNATLT